MATADRLPAIAQARQQLLYEGQTQTPSGLAPWLQRGWQRCMAWDLAPGQRVGFDAVSAARMRQVQEASQPLVQAARQGVRADEAVSRAASGRRGAARFSRRSFSRRSFSRRGAGSGAAIRPRCGSRPPRHRR